MAKLLIVVMVGVLLFSGVAFGQPAGYIGLYTDASTYTNCIMNDFGPALVPVYVVHKAIPGATASQFMVTMGGGFNAIYISEIVHMPLSIGSVLTGISIAYGGCLPSDILLVTINYFTQGISPSCAYLKVVADPASPNGQIEIDDCAFNILLGGGSTLYVNPDGTCQCGPDASCGVHPGALDFGGVAIGASVDKTFTITNTTFGTLSGSVSEACDHYSVVSGGTYNLTAGQSQVVTIRFTPTSVGTHTCTVETGNALCSDVALTGIGDIQVPTQTRTWGNIKALFRN